MNKITVNASPAIVHKLDNVDQITLMDLCN